MIEINSSAGRIGRLGWVNSDTRDPGQFQWVMCAGFLSGFITGGKWGGIYWNVNPILWRKVA